MPIIATVEYVKSTFGRKILTAEQYLEAEKEGEKK